MSRSGEIAWSRPSIAGARPRLDIGRATVVAPPYEDHLCGDMTA
ncbi:hypothetical protein [Actinoallomurus purpureus]|nr:hypothetical protein [Actinoallomurus purpureus]